MGFLTLCLTVIPEAGRKSKCAKSIQYNYIQTFTYNLFQEAPDPELNAHLLCTPIKTQAIIFFCIGRSVYKELIPFRLYCSNQDRTLPFKWQFAEACTLDPLQDLLSVVTLQFASANDNQGECSTVNIS